jgi:hypothetical protein
MMIRADIANMWRGLKALFWSEGQGPWTARHRGNLKMMSDLAPMKRALILTYRSPLGAVLKEYD